MKTKWSWIVGGLLVLLLLLVAIRERFETYEEALKSVGQSTGYITPKCPEGSTMSDDRKTCTTKSASGTTTTVDPTCPSGSKFVKDGVQGHCESVGSSSSSTGTNTPNTNETPESEPVPGSAGSGATAGTTTGGTSGVTYGPNSAPKGGRNVWGPLFKGVGEGPGPVNGDSTKSNAYPSLLGGMQGRSSTRLEGVGIVPPSGFGLDVGGIGLPSSATLGTDENSRYLPYSRQPGDMDLVPDPYRLAKNFSTSSYSVSKTDPVPFLTDFSAFYK